MRNCACSTDETKQTTHPLNLVSFFWRENLLVISKKPKSHQLHFFDFAPQKKPNTSSLCLSHVSFISNLTKDCKMILMILHSHCGRPLCFRFGMFHILLLLFHWQLTIRCSHTFFTLHLFLKGFWPPSWDLWSQAFQRWWGGERSCRRGSCRSPKWTFLQRGGCSSG